MNVFSYYSRDFPFQCINARISARQSAEFSEVVQPRNHDRRHAGLSRRDGAHSMPRTLFASRRCRWVPGIERQAANRNGDMALLDVDWWEHGCVFRLRVPKEEHIQFAPRWPPWMNHHRGKYAGSNGLRCIVRVNNREIKVLIDDINKNVS